MNRTESREAASKILYQIYILEQAKVEYDIDTVIYDNLEIDNNFVKELVKGVMNNKKDIESLANKYLEDWTLDRLSKVDKAIISLGIYELMYTDTPPIVAINEAIELSKNYSDEKVTDMINGILDKIYHEEVENE